MAFMHRQYIFRPVRDVLNFFAYRKYIKKFDTTTPEGRKWLYELNRNIDSLGFNLGVETFETWYEGDQKVGRAQVQRRLELQEMELRAEERDAKINRIWAEEQAKIAEKKAKEQKRKQLVEYSKPPLKPFNPNYKPKAEQMKTRTPISVREPYIGLLHKTYEVRDEGCYVVVLELRGKPMGVYVGKTSLEAGAKATRDCSAIARRNGLLPPGARTVQEVELNAKIKVSKTPSPSGGNINIDISHVNRAMGNNGPSGNNGSSDLDDLLNDIF